VVQILHDRAVVHDGSIVGLEFFRLWKDEIEVKKVECFHELVPLVALRILVVEAPASSSQHGC
jgi:hypothetical protein